MNGHEHVLKLYSHWDLSFVKVSRKHTFQTGKDILLLILFILNSPDRLALREPANMSEESLSKEQNDLSPMYLSTSYVPYDG